MDPPLAVLLLGDIGCGKTTFLLKYTGVDDETLFEGEYVPRRLDSYVSFFNSDHH